jgi:hypothetical protein
MNESITKMTCDWCGKEFSADARACVDAGVVAFHPNEDGEDWKELESISADAVDLSDSEKDTIMRELEINESQLTELLSTGKIEGLGGIVCIECQDFGIDHQEE